MHKLKFTAAVLSLGCLYAGLNVQRADSAAPVSADAPVYPGGPGGRDIPSPPPPRPNPLPAFYDPKLPVERRIDDLMSRLDLEEKVALMQMASPSVPRLGIAPYHWWSEALHGMTHDTATVFPQAIGLSATWNTDLHFKVATAISIEGRAKNREYRENHIFNAMTGLDFWSPNINIFRDPRWGRGQETYGEDPYLSGRFGIEFVKGIQGDHPFYFRAIATPKHYAVHSGPEPIRTRFNAVVTDQDLFTTYLPQFEATVREANAYSAMSTYNAQNGVPGSANKRLLTDILRNQWGFKGFVVSDVDSVADIYRPNSHAYVPTAVEASALAIKAGNELNSGTTYGEGRPNGPSALARAIAQGLITQAEVDLAFRRLMEARFRMGEFDPPGYEGNPYNAITTKMYNTPEHHALALTAAQQSIVLLKNANRTLPLKTSARVLVVGPNANALTMQLGNYNGDPAPHHEVTILDGFRNILGADKVLTPTGLRVPLTGPIALAEIVKNDYLFTDATRTRKGLTVAYAPTPAGLAQPTKTEVSETGALKMPAAGSGVAFDPTLAVRMTGVLVPPATGEYQLGARARDGFKLTLDGKRIVDEAQGGMRLAGSTVHLEKDKPYKVVVEFTHSPTTGASAGGGRGGRGGVPGGPPPGARAGGPPGGVAPAGGPPGAAAEGGTVFVPDGAGGGRGGRGGGGAFGATAQAPGVTAAAGADPASDPLFQIVWTRPAADGSLADTSGQPLYAEAMELAKKADAVVLVVGIDGSQEGEGRDRSSIDLPAVQENLIRAVTRAAGRKPVVVVNCSGSAIALNWANENVPAIVQAWYPGQRGDAVADVIFGKVNPAGRLPVTFYKSTADLPEFTDYAMVDRTYRYFTKPVLYPFGHGLSYTSFAYSRLSAPTRSGTGDDVKVSVQVKNTGQVDGDEVVQLYINRTVPPIDRSTLPAPDKMTDEQATLAATPRKTLVGFSRVPLQAGESRTVTFTVTPQQLALVVGKDGKREVRPERLQIQVGGSSAVSARTLTQSLVLEGQPRAPTYRFVPPSVR